MPIRLVILSVYGEFDDIFDVSYYIPSSGRISDK